MPGLLFIASFRCPIIPSVELGRADSSEVVGGPFFSFGKKRDTEPKARIGQESSKEFCGLRKILVLLSPALLQELFLVLPRFPTRHFPRLDSAHTGTGSFFSQKCQTLILQHF
jgi:hypothetical protein